jgi:HSP20 family molecular chaperone IbpA
MMTLREAMDRLFDDAFTLPISMSGGSVVPAVALYQNENEVVVIASLPGL